jgi:hypothetical protein
MTQAATLVAALIATLGMALVGTAAVVLRLSRPTLAKFAHLRPRPRGRLFAKDTAAVRCDAGYHRQTT